MAILMNFLQGYHTSGSKAGERIFWTENLTQKNHFRFLDLSPELRNRVYWLLFNGTLPVRSKLVKQRIDTHDLRVQYSSKYSYRRGKDPGHVSSEKWYGVTYEAINTPAILIACKQILSEVGPMLYGATPFIFDSTTAIARFGGKVGSMVKFLRTVTFELGFFKKTSSKHAVAVLEQAAELKKLAFSHKDIGFGLNALSDEKYQELLCNVRNLVFTFLPVLEKLHASRSNSAQGSDVLEIMQVEGGECKKCTHLSIMSTVPSKNCYGCKTEPFSEEVMAKHHESLRVLINDIVAYALDLADERVTGMIEGIGICPPGIVGLANPDEVGVRQEIEPVSSEFGSEYDEY
ncbi:hypothetical protein MBLNU230_g5171t1 [Neophaeotheca triangularis]